jgi:AraC-like DNA-binding protein
MAAKTAHNWELRFWRLPHLDNLELLHATGITHAYPAHMHEEHSIGIILQGIETTVCRGNSYKGQQGDLVFINAEEVHSNKSLSSGYRLIKVRPGTLDRIACDLGRPGSSSTSFPQVVVKDPIVARQLLSLHLKLEQNNSPLEQESNFVSTMGLLLSRVSNYRPRRPEVRAKREDVYVKLVRDYLKANYAENVSLSQLTSLTNLSPFYLLRVFHSSTGFPPHEYQTQVRIAHARKLIRGGTSLSQTALETGFFDQSHLSRNFKRIVGVTPRQYFQG